MSEIQETPTSLQALIEKLHGLFAEERVNVDEVHTLLSNYKSDPKEWKRFVNFDAHRYTRNLVDVGNGKFNLILLCWGEGQGSGIHDHADAHCFMKVMDGSVQETLFGWPDENVKVDGMNPVRINKYELNQVAYINDTIGLHRIENTSHTNPAVSLHLYCPPFDSCTSFDERTGKQRKCKVTFWSEFGKRTPYIIRNEFGIY